LQDAPASFRDLRGVGRLVHLREQHKPGEVVSIEREIEFAEHVCRAADKIDTVGEIDDQA
jgi:hypothetical protein